MSQSKLNLDSMKGDPNRLFDIRPYLFDADIGELVVKMKFIYNGALTINCTKDSDKHILLRHIVNQSLIHPKECHRFYSLIESLNPSNNCLKAEFKNYKKTPLYKLLEQNGKLKIKDELSILFEKYGIEINDTHSSVDDGTKLVDILCNDNIDKLQSYIEANKSMNMRLRSDITDEDQMKITIAALYGAIKCFRRLYLEIDFDKVGAQDKKMMLVHAVCGGNIEIIRLLTQKNFELKPSLIIYAARFHHIEIFNWILDQFPFLKEYNYVVFSICLKYDFYEGIECMNDLRINADLAFYESRRYCLSTLKKACVIKMKCDAVAGGYEKRKKLSPVEKKLVIRDT